MSLTCDLAKQEVERLTAQRRQILARMQQVAAQIPDAQARNQLLDLIGNAISSLTGIPLIGQLDTLVGEILGGLLGIGGPSETQLATQLQVLNGQLATVDAALSEAIPKVEACQRGEFLKTLGIAVGAATLIGLGIALSRGSI